MIEFPLKSGQSWTVTASQLADWQQAFPGLDVAAEMQKARAWCVANPSKRKTAVGMPRFLVGWLMREAGKGTLERRVQPRRDIPRGADVWAKADAYARTRGRA